jgi:hypothetical protein
MEGRKKEGWKEGRREGGRKEESVNLLLLSYTSRSVTEI